MLQLVQRVFSKSVTWGQGLILAFMQHETLIKKEPNIGAYWVIGITTSWLS